MALVWMGDAVPCGLVALGQNGQIEHSKQTRLDWPELPRRQMPYKFGLHDVLGRAGAIYFKTHLMPMPQ